MMYMFRCYLCAYQSYFHSHRELTINILEIF
jgi:hypothetical protein